MDRRNLLHTIVDILRGEDADKLLEWALEEFPYATGSLEEDREEC